MNVGSHLGLGKDSEEGEEQSRQGEGRVCVQLSLVIMRHSDEDIERTIFEGDRTNKIGNSNDLCIVVCL